MNTIELRMEGQIGLYISKLIKKCRKIHIVYFKHNETYCVVLYHYDKYVRDAKVYHDMDPVYCILTDSYDDCISDLITIVNANTIEQDPNVTAKRLLTCVDILLANIYGEHTFDICQEGNIFALYKTVGERVDVIKAWNIVGERCGITLSVLIILHGIDKIVERGFIFTPY